MSEESIFAAARQLQTSAARTAFLDTACAGDAALRCRLEELLRCLDGREDFLRRPALEQLAVSDADDATRMQQAETPPDEATQQGDATHDAVLQLLAPSKRPDSLGLFKHYEVLAAVGKGGFGTVLKVFDPKLHRLVAVKVLAPELAASGPARQRFLREARAAAAVRHDHVIDIHAVDDEPLPHLVMEYIDGPTVQQKLDQTGPLPVNEILRLGLQMAAGLAAAHKQGLIHRDVKPSNILLENGVERVKISDFGLARAVDDASLTQSGLVAGTPQYMSPEQAEGKHLDQRSDLFSLGSVLYALCTGHPPFRASASLAVLRRVCEDTPRPIREINSDIPEWLVAIVTRLHAKQPADRFQSAQELADLLAGYLSELQVHGTIAVNPAASAPARGRTDTTAQLVRVTAPRLGRRLSVVMAVVVLAMLAAGAYWAGRPWVSTGGTQGPGPDGAAGAHGALPHVPQPPPYSPGPAEKLPDPVALAKRPTAADALNAKAICPLLLQQGFADPAKVPPSLVAVLGDDHFLLPRGAGDIMRIDASRRWQAAGSAVRQ